VAKFLKVLKKKDLYLDLSKIIETSPAKNGWEKIGLTSHHGINTPLFSLRTKNSSGIGEFLDLISLIDFCHEASFSIIQLLPLNDTGLDPSPYNAISAFALNPIYISLYALPFVGEDDLKPFKQLDKLSQIPYYEVIQLKLSFLKNYFQNHFSSLKEDLSFKAFVETTDWLKPYALFKVFKERFQNRSWNEWPEEYQNPSKEALKALYEKEMPSMEFYFLLQYFAFKQLRRVKSYANQKGVFLKGDIPILISPDSLDVWLYRDYFNLDFSAGAPPDMFTPLGQNWGFPTYHWDILNQNNFDWWKTRLTIAAEFYDIFRIDHIIGFYRIWAIKKGSKATEGSFFPPNEADALAQGEFLLSKLLSFTSMFPIGEDLGLFIDHIRRSLARLAIPGTKIPRWERHYDSDSSFIAYKDYPPLSLTTLSTHDTETLAQWWSLFPADAKQFAQNFNLPYEESLSPTLRLRILQDAHKSSSYFHINLLGEYLALDPLYVHKDPKEERINIPGTLLSSNWCMRYVPTLETLLSDFSLIQKMKSLS
jgi:4-alpha-glucanotransferase